MKKKQDYINNLIDKKAQENNTIDLNAYAIGLSEIYDLISKETLDSRKVIKIFRWLLSNLPPRPEGSGTYYWRSFLRDKIKKELNFEFDNNLRVK